MLPPSTERLILRQAVESDAAFMLKLLTEPSWKRFIRDHDVETKSAALSYLNNNIISGYGEGYGFWIVQEAKSNQPIGICGLIKRDYLEHADIGFGFLEQHWGKGYAAEASRAVISYAFQTLKLPTLLAITRPENRLSIRLLTQLGFRFLNERTDPAGQQVAVYDLQIEAAQANL